MQTIKKTVVITGAASGMGRELALQFAEDGWNLALADLSGEALKPVQTEALHRGAHQILAVALDVSNESEINDFSQQVLRQFPSVDVVINNAGITRMGSFEGASLDAFRQVMDVNFWGVVYGNRAFLPALKESRGSLVNVSSLFGLLGVPGQAAYCSSKFAVRGFTESLRQEVTDDGVHVASVHPGGIATNIARSAIFDEHSEDQQAIVKEIESKALVMPASRAAGIIRAGISKRKDRILIGSDAKFMDRVVRLFPVKYVRLLQRMLPQTEAS